MNIVDSCGWLEYFADGAGADFFAPAIEDTSESVVPVICLFEVFKCVLRQRGEDAAINCVAIMRQNKVVDIDEATALLAARLSHDLRLPMADSMILAIAQSNQAVVWTQDAHFASMPGVRYRIKT